MSSYVKGNNGESFSRSDTLCNNYIQGAKRVNKPIYCKTNRETEAELTGLSSCIYINEQ